MYFAGEKSERVLVTSNYAFTVTDLIVCDGLGHILDETIQQSGVVLIPQESQQSVLLGKRFQSFEDVHQPPANISRERQ